jgi:hypothetical protein
VTIGADVHGSRDMPAYRPGWLSPISYLGRETPRCLRDEEAAGSNPATPTQVRGRLRSWQVVFPVR